MRGPSILGTVIGHRPASYQNPVFDSSFPDPFVFRFGSVFYGYSTGLTESGDLVFPVIRSHDLVNWERVGGAMEMLVPAPPLYWAPEVTYFNGQFYLYYSCGNEIQMEIRVAISSRPDGGFIDSGVRLTDEDFAIDPHVFVDTDGERYLFYATDFLTHTRIGTGTVVDRLPDWFHLEGKPRPVTRARFDWQIYDPSRVEKGNVRWHTVEGPSVLKRKGQYFQMFSGGNWQNASYGVGYAITDEIEGSDEWRQPIDGSVVRPILQSAEGQILGPGHNSVVVGPNNRERFCIYHSWVDGRRVMSIDRLDFVGERMILLGPTMTPQRKPFNPSGVPFLYESAQGWCIFETVSANFLLKAMFRLEARDGSIEFDISTAGGRKIASIDFRSDTARFDSESGTTELLAYPDGVSPSEFQDFDIESNGGSAILLLNGHRWREFEMPVPDETIRIAVSCTAARILSLDLTEGYLDLFENKIAPESIGWTTSEARGILRISAKRLVVQNQSTSAADDRPVIAVKGDYFEAFEFAANICSVGPFPGSRRAYGFAFLSESNMIAMQLNILTTGMLEMRTENDEATEIPLPFPISPADLHQFRFVKIRQSLEIDCEGAMLAKIKIGSQRGRMGIVSYGSDLSIEMVRAIRIGH